MDNIAIHQFFAFYFYEMLSTATDKELALQIEFLKVENQILREKLPKRISVAAQEKQRRLKYGKPLGGTIKHLIRIVTPTIIPRWLQGQAPRKSSALDVRMKIGQSVLLHGKSLA